MVYQDVLEKKKGRESVPLKMVGQVVELNFVKLSGEGKKAEYDVDTVLAKEDVCIDYADTFQLFADRALYRKISATKNTEKEFQGIITAHPKDEQTKCKLTHEKDLIHADAIDLDLNQSKLSLLHPEGTLSSSLIPHQETGEIRFSSNHLLWDHLKNTLVLKGAISIDSDALGQLTRVRRTPD